MRRRRVVAVVLVAMAYSGCGVDGALVGHGRADSWRQVDDPVLASEESHVVNGMMGPGDGYPAWTAVGAVGGGGGQAATKPVVWSALDAVRWTRADLDTGGDRQAAVIAAARRRGVAIAVGNGMTASGHRDARVWTSNDGRSWVAVALAQVAGGRGDQGMTSAAAGPMGFLAAGFDHSGDRGIPAMWSSPDGSTWSRVGQGPGSPFGTGQVITGLAVNERGAVAVGTVRTGGDVDGMAWFSADGVTWRTVPLGLAGFSGRAEQEVRGVTATPDGFVAVGADDNGERRVAVVWRSSDGVSWQRQPPSPDMGQLFPGESTGGVAAAAIAGNGPLVAVGGSGSFRVWTSSDGRRWTGEPPPVEAGRSDDGPLLATEAGGVLVRPGSGGLWFRRPGAAWIDVGADRSVFPVPERFSSIRAMVRSGSGFVALGSVGGGTDAGPAVWTSSDANSWTRNRPFDAGSVEELTVFGDRLVAAGTADDDGNVAAIWISADGGSRWERVAAGNPAFRIRRTTQMFGVTAAEFGLVAVGLSYENDTIDAHAWLSNDGRTWRRAHDPPAWSGPGDQVLGLACPLPGGGVVALGTLVVAGELDAWAWVSSDGLTWERASGPEAAILGGPGLQSPQSCASASSGVLVTGIVTGDGGRDGVVWSTTDGRTWAAAGSSALFAGPSDEALLNIDAEGQRVVVTGRNGHDMTVFTSGDGGSSWEKRMASSFGGTSLRTGHPVIAGSEVVVAGRAGAAAAVWIGPAP